MRYSLIAILVACCVDSQGQDLRDLQSLYAAETASHAEYGVNPRLRHTEIRFLDDKIFVNPEGTLYLFEYSRRHKHLKRLDKSIYHGAFFRRYFFIHNAVPYQFGGEGLFQEHSSLIKFDGVNQDWSELKVQNLSNRHRINFASYFNDSVWLVGHFYNDLENPFYGVIDLENMVFVPGGITEIQNLQFGPFFENYFEDSVSLIGRFLNNREVVFFDKKRKRFYTQWDLPSQTELDYVESYSSGDTIFLFRSDGSNVQIQKSDILRGESAYQFFLSDSNKEDSNWIIPTILAAVIGIVFFLRKAIIMRNHAAEPSLETKLLLVSGEISSEKMNSLFKLDNLTHDNAKVKRNAMIKNLNSKGKVKISRYQDSSDRRRVVYTVEKK